MSYTIHPIHNIFTMQELAEINPSGHSKAFTEMADQEEATFWEANYYELFEEYMRENSQSGLKALDNQYGRDFRLEGRLRVPEPLRLKWLSAYLINLEAVHLTWFPEGTLSLEFVNYEDEQPLPLGELYFLMEYYDQLKLDVYDLATAEVMKMREPAYVQQQAAELEARFDFTGHFLGYQSNLTGGGVSTRLDTHAPEMC